MTRHRSAVGHVADYNFVEVDGYALANASASAKIGGHLTDSVIGKNLADKRQFQRIENVQVADPLELVQVSRRSAHLRRADGYRFYAFQV